MKVARLEVPGNEAKEDVRSASDDRNVQPLVCRIRVPERERPSIVLFLLRPAVVLLWCGLLFAGAP
jgi:hypothetical protein